MKLRAVLLGALLFTTNFVSATEQDFYVGASLGEEVSLVSSSIESGSWVDGRSFKVLGGINIGEYFAVELAYQDLGTQICCRQGWADIGVDIDTDGYSASVIGKLPVGQFDLFAKLGYMFWDQQGSALTIAGSIPYSDDGSDFIAGLGVEYNFTDHFAVRLEWEYFDIEPSVPFYLADGGDTFSLGLRYTF